MESVGSGRRLSGRTPLWRHRRRSVRRPTFHWDGAWKDVGFGSAFGVVIGVGVATGSWWLSLVGIVVAFGAGLTSVMRSAGNHPIIAVPELEVWALSEDVVRTGLLELTRTYDQATFDHSSWLAEIATRLGGELGLSARDLAKLRWAALLHDLGKIAVPKATLSKSTRLSDEELEEIRRHPTVGADLIRAVLPNDEDLGAAVRYHHERWDGCGYPSGLKGEAIPIAARIVAVVDVFEALTSDRSYRSALTVEQAAVYLRNGAGSHFDPEVVKTFLELLSMGKVSARPEAGAVKSGWLPVRWGVGAVATRASSLDGPFL